MAKKRDRKEIQEVPETATISRKGKKIIVLGILTAAVGYFVLTKTDPMGQNWASTLSPFLILGGYGLMGAGILLKDHNRGSNPPSPSIPFR